MSGRKQFDTTSSTAGSSKLARGLPQPEDLKSLAMTYLTEQSKHWPKLVGSQLLPAACDDAAIELAAEFSHRHLREVYDPTPVRVSASQCNEVGAAYVRYSDANSNVRSLDQQLVNILAAASRERIFVPWSFVFADAAISGTVAARPGYQRLVKAIEAKGCIVVAIVDELDRLTRDQEVSTKFRKLLEKLGKRLITSHGFDSTNPNAKVNYTISSLTSDLFIDQLKLKVDRGMTDSVKQGRHVAAPPLGYRLAPRRDDAGQPVLDRNRKVVSDIVIDQDAADVVKRVFELYSLAKKSPKSIAKMFNQEQVLGRSTWNTSGIANLLTHELYIGIMKWKQTRNHIDSETGLRTTTQRPANEHVVTEVPELRIIPDELWEAMCNRKKEVARPTRMPGQGSKSRQSQYATRLFDLYCGDCNRPLQLTRSGKYAQLQCPSNSEGKTGCSLTVSKTLKQIEECILGDLSRRLIDDESLETMVSSANAFLEEEAAKPAVDIAAIDKKIRAANEKIKRATERLIDLDTGPAADLLVEKIKREEDLLEELQRQKARGTEQNFRPEPLTLQTLNCLVNHLRLLLQEDVVAAHAALAKALGRVYVSIGPKRGKRYSWLAELTIDPVPVLIEISARANCPSKATLEFLRVRSWTILQTVTSEVRAWGNAERYAKTVGEMLEAGSTRAMVATALRIDPETVEAAAVHFAAGTGCTLAPADFSHRRASPASKVDKIAADVVRMIDEEGLTVHVIAKRLGASERVVSQAYKQAKPELTLKAATDGKEFKIPVPLKLPKETHERIQELLLAGGMSYRAIAREVGCDHHAVSEAHKRMKAKDAA